MADTVDIYNQEQITAALGQIKTALDSLISAGIPVDLTGYVRTDHTGDIEVDGQMDVSGFVNCAGGLLDGDVNVGNDLIVDGDISGGDLDVATALIGETTIPTGAKLAVGGGIAVTNGSGGGTISGIGEDGLLSLHSNTYRHYHAGGTSIAAGDAIARVNLTTTIRGAIVRVVYRRIFEGVAIATARIIRNSSGVISVVLKQDFTDSRKIAVPTGATAAYADIFITDASDTNVAADSFHDIDVELYNINSSGSCNVTFPNH